ncbi:MAG: MerR family transcriptional regulator [bacterium]|nr:MerR family transcriptional regulator [bacterium]
MMKNDKTYSISELAALGDVSPRTVRYYVQLGVLPPPAGRGLGGKYGPQHLERLLKVRELQREGVHLEQMAAFLDRPETKDLVCEVSRHYVAEPRAELKCLALREPPPEPPALRRQVVTRVEVAEGVWLEFAAGAGMPVGPRLERIVRLLRDNLDMPSGEDPGARRGWESR